MLLSSSRLNSKKKTNVLGNINEENSGFDLSFSDMVTFEE